MSLAERNSTPWPLMPATQSAFNACCALAPKPEESAKKCDFGEQSSKCQKPKLPPLPGSLPPEPALAPPTLTGGAPPPELEAPALPVALGASLTVDTPVEPGG